MAEDTPAVAGGCGDADVRVAAVILTVDQCADTLRCLDSLARSGAESFAVVVLDNGSRDDTADVLRRRHPEAAVLRSEKNLGASGGRNRAADEAIRRYDPEYLLFLDNDTEVRPGFLAPLVAPLDADIALAQTAPKLLLRSDPDRLDMAGGAEIAWWRGETMGRGRGEVDRGQYDEPADCVAGGCMLVRASAFREVGGFDPVFDPYGYEDMDFSLRLLERGYGCRYAPESVVLHENTQTFERGRYTARYGARKAKNWLVFLFRHAPVGARIGFFVAGVPWLALRRIGRMLGLVAPPPLTSAGKGPA